MFLYTPSSYSFTMARKRNPDRPYVNARIDKDVMNVLDRKIYRGETLSQGLRRILKGRF